MYIFKAREIYLFKARTRFIYLGLDIFNFFFLQNHSIVRFHLIITLTLP